VEELAIGFYVFRHNGPSAQKLCLASNAEIIGRSPFIKCNLSVPQVVNQSTLELEVDPPTPVDPFHLIIVPSTFQPGLCADFTLAVHADPKPVLQRVMERWSEASVQDQWLGETAGGCRNHKTWSNNPQFALTFADTAAMPNSKAIVILCQDASRNPLEAIGFYVLNQSGQVVAKASFMRAPEVCVQIPVDTASLLSAGRYSILPCTFAPGAETTFSLSVFAPVQCEMSRIAVNPA